MNNLRTRKIVRIDEDKCDGCGLCVPSCAEGAIRVIDGKARLLAENLCDGLGNCLGKCPKDAIIIEQRPAEEFDEAAVEKRKDSGFRLQASDSSLQTSDFRLQPSDSRLQAPNSGLQTSDFRLQTSGGKHRLPATDYRLPPAARMPQAADVRGRVCVSFSRAGPGRGSVRLSARAGRRP